MRYRTLWVSDVHLGRPGCQAEQLATFLCDHDCERLYLVGDIIDGWKLRKHWYWPQAHANVVREILSKAEQGTRSEEHTSELQSLMRISYAVFCLKKKKRKIPDTHKHTDNTQ